MTRISRIERAPGEAPPVVRDVADFQKLREIGAQFLAAEVPREQTEREFITVLAGLLDAEACALAVKRDGKLVLRDMVLDQPLADRRAVLSSELRLVAASTIRDQRSIAEPCESIAGRIMLAAPSVSGAYVLLTVVRGNSAKLAGYRATLELAALVLNVGQQSDAQQLAVAADAVLGLKPTELSAASLRELFGATMVVISGRRGRVADISPSSTLNKDSPAGRLIAEAFARPSTDSPQTEAPEIAAALNASAARMLGTDRPNFRILVATPGGAFEHLSQAHWAAIARMLPVSRKLMSAAASRSQVGILKRLPALVVIAALLGVMAIPIEDRIRADAFLEPDGKRFVTAQFSAILAETLVKPGDSVAAGDVLGRLEGEALQLARTAADTRADDAARRRDTALRAKEIAAAELSRLDERSAIAERDLLDWRLERLELRAPIDGVVLASNLEDSAGAPVREGDLIFEISPLDKLRVRIDIPIVDLARLPEDPAAVLVLDGKDSDIEIELGSLSPQPRAIVSEGETVLPHDATILNESGELRPGQKGLVIVPTGEARIGEILFRRAWIRMSRWLR